MAAGHDVVSRAVGKCLDGSNKLRQLPTNIYFWFAWFAFHPETDVYEVA